MWESERVTIESKLSDGRPVLELGFVSWSNTSQPTAPRSMQRVPGRVSSDRQALLNSPFIARYQLLFPQPIILGSRLIYVHLSAGPARHSIKI